MLTTGVRCRYNHLDMDDLEAKLQEAEGARVRLIATDGNFPAFLVMPGLAQVVLIPPCRGRRTTHISTLHSVTMASSNGPALPTVLGVEQTPSCGVAKERKGSVPRSIFSCTWKEKAMETHDLNGSAAAVQKQNCRAKEKKSSSPAAVCGGLQECFRWMGT